MEIDRICDVDNDFEDPQLCATLASDIYMHLREAEVTILSSALIPIIWFPSSTEHKELHFWMKITMHVANLGRLHAQQAKTVHWCHQISKAIICLL